MAETKERHLKKYMTLSTQDQQKQTAELQNQITIDKSKWVVNLSTNTLSPHEKDLLEKGLNFLVTPKNIPTKNIADKVETVVKNLPMAEADNIRAKTNLVLQKASPTKGNPSKKQRQALHSLKEDKQIAILPADKGRATVILNKEDYIKKCNDQVDSGPYIKLKKDPTERIKREARTKLAIVRDNGTIDQSLYFKLKPTDSQASRFYGLPKIHKASIPVRPIVSYSRNPLFNLSKYIANILKPYTQLNKQHCKNSKEFSEFIRTHTIEEDEIMVSFDVEALYTNVPIGDALTIFKELLENDEALPDRTPLLPKNVLDLSEFLLCKTFFIFNGTYYQQTEGVAMGGPPSSIVPEIYMQATETTALTTTSHPPKVWGHHVDDVFSIIRKSNLHDFFQHINSLHPKTKFTLETEENSQLPFLDTLIQRNRDNTISVRVYRKPTYTDQYLKFTSHHLARAKTRVITSLFDRTKNIISNLSDKEKEENHLTAVLQANGYPKEFIKTQSITTTKTMGK